MEIEAMENKDTGHQDDGLKGFNAVSYMVVIFLSVGLAGIIAFYISWKWTIVGAIILTISIVWFIHRDGEREKKEEAGRAIANAGTIFRYLIIVLTMTLSVVFIFVWTAIFILATCFDPLQLEIYGIDFSGLVKWKWLWLISIVAAWAMICCILRGWKKEQAERRLANKILAERGMEPLEEMWIP
ncbi:MAG: hypothetical protein V1801_03085 [Candidatus Falkowbacteria bacterium]